MKNRISEKNKNKKVAIIIIGNVVFYSKSKVKLLSSNFKVKKIKLSIILFYL